MWQCSTNGLFPPQVVFGCCVCHKNREQKGAYRNGMSGVAQQPTLGIWLVWPSACIHPSYEFMCVHQLYHVKKTLFCCSQIISLELLTSSFHSFFGDDT